MTFQEWWVRESMDYAADYDGQYDAAEAGWNAALANSEDAELKVRVRLLLGWMEASGKLIDAHFPEHLRPWKLYQSVKDAL